MKNDDSAPISEPTTRTVEVWAREHKISAWDMAGARSLAAWGIGSQATEAAFLTAIENFRAIQLGTKG